MSVVEGIETETGIARCVVLSISGSLSSNHDKNAHFIENLLHGQGHELIYRRVLKNHENTIREGLAEALAEEGCNLILITGGTGIAKRDITYDILRQLYESEIPGFGELFRDLAYKELGPKAMLTRASAGIIEGCLVFSLPGSPPAVKLGMERLIIPTLNDIVGEMNQ
ncbi:MAG: molybdenum cofactor biosynthesis protein MoaB [Candidatus Omnitrophica bacterium]|nr:molybdenum cofactor biosynthesis protein MoaB [Candidatus Omnitrophota bacterium]MCA9415733.1 molybdenum cofactor biosynthesis protein MoaB [Candidatus Omnitrophota bacterium]MCA9423892.1 molybdenum cofactor biosynthesis protein MoaB [Candidatus Omnitrophota bacterium]MCA9429302.1 molybdenum cofactor biosynthesis protein MoaB [Candidatus Omnitrophota bacterium]MCA9434950.1 molybdenum cofactor biosynthesis protein MoaB [Candidatus Omnitrophota bacterium]